MGTRRCHTDASVGPVGPAGRREHGAGERYAPGTDAPPICSHPKIAETCALVTASVRPPPYQCPRQRFQV